jgi:hypothetical protein
VRRGLLAFACLAPLACAEPAPLVDAESPSAVWRAAIARAEAKLFASDFAASSPAARRATEQFLAALIDHAWTLAGDAELLDAPVIDGGQGIAGRPGLFNPDNASRSALLEPGGSYRITGRRGTHLQLLLQVLDAWPLIALGQNRGVIDVDALGVAPGQDFELFLGGARRAGHWFPLAEDARTLVVRMTFGDWAAETPSELRIERLDAAREEAPGSRFSRAAEYLEQTLELWTGTFMLRMKLVPVNELRAPAPTRDGLAGQYSVLARFELAPGEALLITSPVSAASYQGIQLGDPWFATPDWAHRQVSLNRSQARADADGKLRYVVSASDPGVPNWLDTGGFATGYVFMRWQGLDARLAEADAPGAEVVKLVELRTKLPADTPVLDAAARARQLAARRVTPMRK